MQNIKKPLLKLKSDIFFELFPFHIVFKRNLEITSTGDALLAALKYCNGEKITDIFNMDKPLIEFTWENVCIFML